MNKLHDSLKFLFFTLFISSSQVGLGINLNLFPLDNYNQKVDNWIDPNDPHYNKPLLSTAMQKKYYNLFLKRYFGNYSPWNANFVEKVLSQSAPDNIPTIEEKIIEQFNNEGKPPEKIGYGENFRPYTKAWIDAIADNVDVKHFAQLTYQASNRAIATDNLNARVLPTDDVHFYNHEIAGQGYPFDNLQISAIYVGTPVYIIGQTRDHTWSLILTPDLIGWVKSNGLAYAHNNFISDWTKAANNKLIAITKNKTAILNNQQNFLFYTYIGTFFPVNDENKILIPVKDVNQAATIQFNKIDDTYMSFIPATMTTHAVADILSKQISRPYGWGNMYFYNDCSAELKNLFITFGIWLPRHSSDQVHVGKMIDVSQLSPKQRIDYLMKNGMNHQIIYFMLNPLTCQV